MTWMMMLASEACESTLVMRTLHSWKSSSFILSLMACAILSQHPSCSPSASSIVKRAYPLSHTNLHLVRLVAADVLTPLVIVEVQLVRSPT